MSVLQLHDHPWWLDWSVETLGREQQLSQLRSQLKSLQSTVLLCSNNV